MRRALDGGLRQIAFLLVPAGLVSIVLAEPIVRLVYQRGEFTAEDTVIVAQCLQAFSIGLVFNGWMLILNRSFYAVQTNWVPTGDRARRRRPQRRASTPSSTASGSGGSRSRRRR